MPGPAVTPIAPDEWSDALAATDGLQLVVAGPGAGKTEFLARRAHHLVTGRGRPASSVATFHSFAVRLLERHGPSVLGWSTLPALLTGPEQVGVVRRVLSEEDPAAWPTGYREMLGTRSFAEEVTDFMLRASERRLSPTDVAALAADAQGQIDLAELALAAIVADKVDPAQICSSQRTSTARGVTAPGRTRNTSRTSR